MRIETHHCQDGEMPREPIAGFRLAGYLARLETTATHNLAASYAEPMSVDDVLAMATDDQRSAFFGDPLVYTNTWGAEDLRQAVATVYEAIDQDHVLAFAGASEGIFAANNVLLDMDSHAIVIGPNYQSHEALPQSICETTVVPLDSDNDWSLDLARVAAAIRPSTRLITMNFPHNPSGTILPIDVFEALIALCRHHGIHLLHDEIYHGLGRTGVEHLPFITDAYELGLSVNAVSKAYGMPGLRVGWIATQDRPLLERMERMKHYLTVSIARPSERLAVVALEHRDEILARNRRIVDENLPKWDRFFARFPDLFEWERPQASCMGLVRYLGGNVDELCRSLFDEAGVLLLPASVYDTGSGIDLGERFRIGFGCRGLETGIDAMVDYFDPHASSGGESLSAADGGPSGAPGGRC